MRLYRYVSLIFKDLIRDGLIRLYYLFCRILDIDVLDSRRNTWLVYNRVYPATAPRSYRVYIDLILFLIFRTLKYYYITLYFENDDLNKTISNVVKPLLYFVW